jgi:hypothetical protein
VAAVGLAVLALVAATGSGTATAEVTASPTAVPTYVRSWLALDTGASSAVRLVKADKTLSGTPQVLSSGKACALDQGGAGLLGFSSSPASPGVGFANGSIGVREKRTSSGTSCSAVDSASSEKLTLKLGTGVGKMVAMSASLDVDLKQSSRILATATLSSSPATPPAYFELQSGSSIGQQPPLEAGATIFTCNNPADSGPDSGANNNCRWEISAPSWTRVSANGAPPIAEDGVQFDTLTLEARVGSFSLMGGADGPVDDPAFPLPSYLGADADPSTPDVSITGSIFELAEGSIGCGETATLSGTIASSWKRLANASDEACKPFAYSSRTGTDAQGAFAEFTKPLDFQTQAQALWTSTFPVAGGGSTPPPIRVELDVFGSTTKIIFDPLLACPAAYVDSSGVFVGPSSVPSAPTACLVSAVRGTGKLSKTATYTAYIFGDAGMRN